MISHPELVPNKKSNSPDADKSIHDARLLIPTLKDFFHAHPLINPKIFLGDAAFDAVNLYKDLLSGDTFGTDKHFSKAYIPLNTRAHLENKDYMINENGIPCCPHEPGLAMKPETSNSHLRCGTPTFKFVCPKMTFDKCDDGKYRRFCHCETPCTSSRSGRMIYYILKKTFGHAQVFSAVLPNGIPPTKSEPLLNVPLTTLKILLDWLTVEHKMKKHFMPT